MISSAFAEGVDLAAMSLSELQELNKAILAEIDNRFGKGLGRIGAGYYIVGKDIQAGNYNLVNCEVVEEQNYGHVKVYDNEEMFDKGEERDFIYVYDGGTVTLLLQDGEVIKISHFAAEVEECKASWMIN